MDQGFYTVLGMSIAFFFAFLGLLLAWYSYRKHHGEEKEQS